jgi:hypothetical protein
MTTPQQEVDDMYAKLKPGAVTAAQQYIMSRTPSPLGSLMAAKIAADLDPPPDPMIAEVHNGDLIPIQNSVGGAYPVTPAVAIVTGGSLTAARLPASASTVLVQNGGACNVVNQANAAVSGSPGTITVTAGVLTNVKLSV